MGKYYLAIDQGTTGSTALLVNAQDLKLVDKINQEYPQIYPSPGLVEHDLGDIWQSVSDVIKKVISKNNVDPGQIRAIGITNQRETICAFTKSGESLHNAIVWQDRRTADFCDQLKEKGLEDQVKQVTGLTLDPYFSEGKVLPFLMVVLSLTR